MRILAADIGGTKTLFQISQITNAKTEVLFEQRYASNDWGDFSDAVKTFLDQAGEAGNNINAACFAVAGPVASDGLTASVTNLPWVLNSETLKKILHIPEIVLINDFQAVGFGIDELSESELVTLQHGSPQPQQPRLVIGAGTGLGVAQTIWQNDRYHVLPSEAGHGDFAATNSQQSQLLEYLKQKYQQVSWEMLLSGKGISNIYDFLRDSQHRAESNELKTALKDQSDAAAVISQFADKHCDPLACATLKMFVSIYGAAAGNLALTTLPYNGVFIAGGIAAKILDFMTQEHFIKAFVNKSKMKGLLSTVPVHVVTNANVGLLGANLIARYKASNTL